MNRRSEHRILMLLQNESYPDDTRVELEARSLREAGYQVTVVCPTGISSRFHENVAGVHVYRYLKPWEVGGFVGYVWEYAYSLAMALVVSLYVLVRRGFDVVHVHAPPDLYVLISGFYKLLGKRYVLDMHDLSPELYQARQGGAGNRTVLAVLSWFEWLACRSADRLIATNETQRRVQIERAGATPERCCVVRNGPDDRFLASHEPIARLHEGGRVIIGYVGMMGVQDGVEYLLRAVDILRTEIGRDDFRTVIVGSGPALTELKRLATELNLQDHVEFAGYRTGEDLLRHLASFDICVTPDPSNPYNDSCTTIKTMEYMAMGKPVVAFDLPENRVTASDAALYAARNDQRDLARLIARLMDRPIERQQLGQRGRQRVIDLWRWDIQEQHLIELYDDLLGCDVPDAERDAAGEKPTTQRQARPARVTARSASPVHS
jgi:glycosyltransferase involved in cell wall biosynthesis